MNRSYIMALSLWVGPSLALAATPAGASQSPDVLYDTNTDKEGFASWPLGTPDWKLLNKTLLNDGTGPRDRFAATFAANEPETSNFAVEATIRVVQDPRDAASFGLVVRANGRDGYAAGIGRGWGESTHVCYLTGMWTSNAIRDCKTQGQQFKPDLKWHTYRVEAKDNTIRLLIDRAVMASLTDNRFLSPGHVGLWCAGYQLEVKEFRVIRLNSE